MTARIRLSRRSNRAAGRKGTAMRNSEDSRMPGGGQGERQAIHTPRRARGPWRLLALWLLVVAVLLLVGLVGRWLR